MQAPPDDEGTSSGDTPGGSNRRRTIGRIVLLLAFAVSLYLVAPGLLALFGKIPQLRAIFPAWFLAVGVLEGLAFASIWELTRVALKTKLWFDVVCSQLAGNA